ncbi:hypothetical protein ATANTOWER_015363 [Ataeniobius toweri]|uniref:Uncharacterized protein n=1 Tax=Ataeniobius toweri TaxID=208326 RepID=A0ABU7C7S0_9TELE|nr:hypothetical protein [Ataeniobius toweri]
MLMEVLLLMAPLKLAVRFSPWDQLIKTTPPSSVYSIILAGSWGLQVSISSSHWVRCRAQPGQVTDAEFLNQPKSDADRKSFQHWVTDAFMQSTDEEELTSSVHEE